MSYIQLAIAMMFNIHTASGGKDSRDDDAKIIIHHNLERLLFSCIASIEISSDGLCIG